MRDLLFGRTDARRIEGYLRAVIFPSPGAGERWWWSSTPPGPTCGGSPRAVKIDGEGAGDRLPGPSGGEARSRLAGVPSPHPGPGPGGPARGALPGLPRRRCRRGGFQRLGPGVGRSLPRGSAARRAPRRGRAGVKLLGVIRRRGVAPGSAGVLHDLPGGGPGGGSVAGSPGPVERSEGRRVLRTPSGPVVAPGRERRKRDQPLTLPVCSGAFLGVVPQPPAPQPPELPQSPDGAGAAGAAATLRGAGGTGALGRFGPRLLLAARATFSSAVSWRFLQVLVGQGLFLHGRQARGGGELEGPLQAVGGPLGFTHDGQGAGRCCSNSPGFRRPWAGTAGIFLGAFSSSFSRARSTAARAVVSGHLVLAMMSPGRQRGAFSVLPVAVRASANLRAPALVLGEFSRGPWRPAPG